MSRFLWARSPRIHRIRNSILFCGSVAASPANWNVWPEYLEQPLRIDSMYNLVHRPTEMNYPSILIEQKTLPQKKVTINFTRSFLQENSTKILFQNTIFVRIPGSADNIDSFQSWKLHSSEKTFVLLSTDFSNFLNRFENFSRRNFSM